MNTRPRIPINIQRCLWFSSAGYCMNPGCRITLLPSVRGEQKFIGDIAHIKPHSEGGTYTEDNLILLCRNCHRKYETLNNPGMRENLKSWKDKSRIEHEKFLQEKIAVKFETFDELSEKVKPLLLENYEIFNQYGPRTGEPEVFKLWQEFEPQLISNNARLKLLLAENIDLFPSASDERYSNQKAICHFNLHVDEFAITRNGFDGVRKVLFPWRILSIFGIESERHSQENNINNIQNLIKSFQDKDYKVELNLYKEPHLRIEKNNQIETIYLDDNPRVSQLIFSLGSESPSSTEMRLDNLKFFLNIFEKRRIHWSFDDISNLTIVTINGSIKVKLFYSYNLSLADLQSTDFSKIDYIANLHNWNDGPITSDAIEFAKSMSVKAMTSKEFQSFILSLGDDYSK